MTVGIKMHTTLATLEGALSDFKTYALDTQDQGAKQMFNNYAQQLESIVSGLKGRTNYIENQEPQYKVFQKPGQ